MTEKRFYLLNYNNYPIYDSLNDKEYNAQFKAQREKLCLLLNELAEENEYYQIKSGKCEEELLKLRRDNKELAEENQQCKEYNAKLYSNSMKSEKQLLKQIKELKEENKEVRSERDYWKTLAQSLAKTNGNVELKDEHLAWKRVDVE